MTSRLEEAEHKAQSLQTGRYQLKKHKRMSLEMIQQICFQSEVYLVDKQNTHDIC